MEFFIEKFQYRIFGVFTYNAHYKCLVFIRKSEHTKHFFACRAASGGRKLHIRVVSACFEEKTQGVHKKDLKNRADYARITLLYSALTLRTRQPGDRFRPAGRGLSKPLRKWMNEAGIPAGIREGLPLLAAGSEILWVCGEGFAEGLAPDEETVQILQLKLENGGTTHEYE